MFFFPLTFPNTVRHLPLAQRKISIGYCTLPSLAFVGSVVSLQEILDIAIKIAMIYSELRLLAALR